MPEVYGSFEFDMSELDADDIIEWFEDQDESEALKVLNKIQTSGHNACERVLELFGVEEFLKEYVRELQRSNKPNAFVLEKQIQDYLNAK